MSDARHVMGVLVDARSLLVGSPEADALIEWAIGELALMADEEERGQLSSEKVVVTCLLDPHEHTLADCLAAEHERSEGS